MNSLRYLLAVLLAFAPSMAMAEMEPLTYRSLNYRVTNDGVNGSASNGGDTRGQQQMLSGLGRGTCGNIVIGSVISDRPIYGNVDINVNIKDSVTLRCGRF